jgi:quercetin dioxygenase-like cupin family protein
MNPSDPKLALPILSDDGAQAALHALGALDPVAAAHFEARVDEDRTLESELGGFVATVGDLGLVTAAEAPPATVLKRLLDRVRPAVTETPPAPPVTPFAAVVQQARALATTGMTYLAGDADGFTPLALPGITARTLHRDDAAGYATVLVRMQPGADYPAHRHGGDEECYVLEGDLQVGDHLQMRAGDYQLAARDSVHPVQRTTNGCLLLLRSSLHDELIAAS